jgi:hypothetical protein
MMLWGGREVVELQARIDVLEAEVIRERRSAEDWAAQCRLLRALLTAADAAAREHASMAGEFLALTREASGLRTTVTFLNGHVEALARERQELLSVLLRAPVETARYEVQMEPPTPGQEVVAGLGRAASAADVGDALNRLRDIRDGVAVKAAADDLGMFDDLGDPPPTE